MPRKHARYPGIEAMSHGRKRIRLRAVDPRTGRMKEVDRIIEASTEDAVLLREQWRKEIHTSDQRSVVVPRLDDYATSWMKSRTLAVKPSTARTYAEILDCHVMPALGDFFLDKITDKDVREWHVGLAGKRAAATANNALRMLKMVMSDGCADFNLARSPAERVRAIPLRHAPDDDPNILSPEELGKVLGEFGRSEAGDYPLALTLALTGLRFGEATALKWGDVREEEGQIRVVRAQWKGHISTTKTGVARTVPLVAELAAALRAHRARLVAGQHAGLKEGWIFAEEEGGVLRKNYLRRPLLRVLKVVGIKGRFTVHGFRRTFNNIARQVAGEIVTRAITGHVTQAMTEHYSHVGRDEKLAAAGSVVRLVLGPREGDRVEVPSGGSGGGSSPDSDSADAVTNS
jgi:integrase